MPSQKFYLSLQCSNQYSKVEIDRPQSELRIFYVYHSTHDKRMRRVPPSILL
nr:MAG TPA: hypothetical protein [Caudoviricetes sp.]